MDSTQHARRLAPRLIVVTSLLVAGLLVIAAQPGPAAHASGVSTPKLAEHFVPNGPAPMVTGSTNTDTNAWSGAIGSIVVDPVGEPNRPRQVWIGSVNGGVWRTRTLDVEQTDQDPSWTPQTDDQPSLSVSALALDPTDIDLSDRNGRTLVAGIGASTSAVGQPHGPQVGVLRSTDAGNTWRVKDSVGLIGSVTGVLARGPVIVASTTDGVYRSHDFGDTFTKVIPGSAMALTEDPANLGRVFVAVLGAHGGVFRAIDITDNSSDNPSAWDLVEPLTAFGPVAETTTTKVALSARAYPTAQGGVRTVVVGATLADDDPSNLPDDEEKIGVDLANEFRSAEGGAPGTWQVFDPVDDVVLEHQGKLVVANDDASSITFYISGDQGDTYRCDVDGSALNCGGLGGPDGGVHFDRRGLVFDDGEMLMVGDGGIYERTNPQDEGGSVGTWYDRQGDLAITESYKCAYDDLAQVSLCANQDNAISIQPSPGALVWDDSAGFGDGTVVAISDAPVGCSTSSTCSTRYFSGQNLRNFTRARCDAANQCDDTVAYEDDGHPALLDLDKLDEDGNPISIGCTGFPVDPECGDPNLGFLTPVAANPTDGNRVIVASGTDGIGTVYESFDGAETFHELSGFTGRPTGAILYGAASNPNAIYVGSTEGLFVRAGAGGSVSRATDFDPSVSGRPTAIAVDPNDADSAWVVTDKGNVLHSIQGTEPSAAWARLTGDLHPGGFGAFGLRAVAVIPAGPTSVVAVGGDDGIYVADSNAPRTWFKLSGELPNVVVSSLQYDVKDDLLVIGTIGRSSWLLPHASQLNLPPVLDASASDDSGDFNDPAHFSARLTDARGEPLTGEPVHFALTDGHGSTQTCASDPVTNANGVATCDVVLALDPGGYTLEASSPGHGTLVPSSDSQPFTITKEETAIQYTGPRSGDTHDPVHVTATIFDPDGGAPIAGKRVTFTLGNPVLGQQCTSAPSDADGHAGCDITPFQPAGDYLVVAEFSGGPNYLASSSPPVTFTLLREESTLTLDPAPHLVNGASATLGATLVEDTSGPPVLGVPITFTIGSGPTTQTCTHNTDINGHASCTFAVVSQPASASSVPITATFAGNDFYLPASASATSRLVYYQGRATGLSVVQSLLLPMASVTADTGLITTSAASHTERLQSSISTPLVSIKTLDSTVDTGGGSVTSTSTAAGITISAVGVPLITITSLSSTASATCGPTFVASALASTTLGSLRIGGLPVTLTSGPNQTVNLGLVKLVLNEQQPLPGASAGIQVNGLHLTGLGLDVVVSHAQAAVFNCP